MLAVIRESSLFHRAGAYVKSSVSVWGGGVVVGAFSD